MPGAYLPPVITRLTMEPDNFLEGIAKAKLALESLNKSAEIVITDNIDEVIAKLALLGKAMDAVNDKKADFDLKVNGDAIDKLYLLNKRVTGFSTRLGNSIKRMAEWSAASLIFGEDVDALAEKFGKLDAAAATSAFALGAMLQGEAALIRAETSDITRANAELLRAQTAAKRQAQGGGGGFWGLGGKTPIWAGTPLEHGVPIWHPIADVVIESVIALAAAFIDLALAGAALAPAAVRIYDRMDAIKNVTDSLGGSMGGLGGTINSFTRSVSGLAVEGFGGLLNMFQKNTGAMQIISRVIVGLDDEIAKLDLFFNSRGNGNGILTFGLSVLHQFEQIFNSLGVAFSNIARDDPGTIHYMLDLVQAAAKLLEILTELPSWLVKGVLQLHAMWLWGGLLYSQLAKIPGVAKALGAIFGTDGILFGGITKQFGEATTAAGKLGAILSGGIVLGTILTIGFAVEQIVTHWNNADGAVSKYVANQNAALANMNAEQAFNAIPNMISAINGRIPKVNAANLVQGMSSIHNLGNSFSDEFQAVAQAFGKSGSSWGNMAHFFKVAFDPGARAQAGAAVEASKDVQLYRNQIQGLSKDQQQLFGTMVGITKQGYSVQTSFALMNLAGVKASDGAKLAAQKVQNLIAGYKEMGIQGRLMANSVNAVNFNTWLGDSNISKVTAGWTSFISTVTGGVSAFQTYMLGINAFKTQAGSLTGFDTNSLTKQQDFSANITNASAMINSLYTLAAVSKQGAAGTNAITTATKAMLIQMVPAVGGNKALQSSLIALAQQGGAPWVKTMGQLTQWMGNMKNPAQTLSNIMTQMTGASSNLSQDIQNLASAMNPTMTSAMDQAIVAAAGGTKVLENWANAVLNGHTPITQFVGDAQGLYKEITDIYGATATGRTQFEAYNQMMGISKQQSDALWKALQSGSIQAIATVIRQIELGQQAIDSLHGKTIYINMVTTGRNITTPQIPGVNAPLHALGTQNAPSGWNWVGDKGPELIRLRGGEQILSNSASVRAAASGGGDSVHEVNVYLDGKKVYRSVQKNSAQTQRRTGTSGLSRRTR